MRILTTSFGTLGDHVPTLALSVALRNSGHEVAAAVGEAALPLYGHERIPARGSGSGLSPEVVQQHPWLFDYRASFVPDRAKMSADIEDMPRNYRELARLAREFRPDVLIAGAGQRAARFVSEDQRIPWVSLCTHRALFRAIKLRHETHAPRVILACSPVFDDTPIDEQIVVTGFVYYDSAAQPGWSKPSPALEQFVAEGHSDGFLLLLPGSLPHAHRAEFLRHHVEAAREMGRRIVVQRGWAGLGPELLPTACDHVFFADALPHDWLLARAAAVICPGRIGVVAGALRAGCPILVEPRTRDGFNHARRLRTLGVGVALDSSALSQVGIRRILEEKLLLPAVRERAARLAALIAAEAGVTAAVAAIERWMKQG